MPKAPFNPIGFVFRLFTPGQLFICVILFFLPWVEVSCSIPKSLLSTPAKQQGNNQLEEQAKNKALEDFKKETGIDPTKPIGLISQSGFQIATGDASPGSDVERIKRKMKEKMGPQKPTPPPKGEPNFFDLNGDQPEFHKKAKDESIAAPLLFAYPVFLVAGIGLTFLPIMPLVRRLIVAGCCAAALGVVVLQVYVIGLPIDEKVVKKANNNFKQTANFANNMGGMQPGGNPNPPDLKEDVFQLSYQIPLYATLFLLFTAGGSAFADALFSGGAVRHRKNRKRPRDEYDDEDEENDRKDDYDEDDRPRKKKRRYEDDADEDDRPRKKSRRDDDEEEERPRKKKVISRDDEEEDEKPRKKTVTEVDKDEEDAKPQKKPVSFEVVEDAAPPPQPKPAVAPKPAVTPKPTIGPKVTVAPKPPTSASAPAKPTPPLPPKPPPASGVKPLPPLPPKPNKPPQS